MTLGGGLKINLMNNQYIQLDYSHRTMGVFGDLSSYTVSFSFLDFLTDDPVFNPFLFIY